MLKKIFQVQNIQIKSITGIIKDLSHANKLQSLQDFHFLSNSISQQPIKQHNSQINDPWSFFWSKTSCEFNISLNLRLFSKKKKKNLSVPGVELFGNAGLLVHGGPHKNQKRKIERERERERGRGTGGAKWSFHARFSFSSSFSRRGSDKYESGKKERKKERKNGKKGKKERSKSHNRTEQSTTCSAPLPLDFFFILFIFIYYKLKFYFIFFDVFCCCCCLFLFLPIFSLGFGVRTCVPVGGVFGAWWPFLIFGTCGGLGFEMEGSTLAQCALGPLPFLSRHVSSNFCTIQRLNYTLMCSKIWGYQPKKKKKKV